MRLLLLLMMALPVLAATPTTTVLLVRHAEAGHEGDDPALTEAGTARAQALVAVAENAGVEVIITSDRRRTKDTAAPLATAKKIPMVEVRVERGKVPQHVVEVAKRIAAEYAGKTILVVGHSNTIPLIVKELTGIEPPAIEQEDNTRLFIVTLGEKKSVVAAQYGCP